MTLDGRPVTTGQVVLVPESDTKAPVAVGAIQEDGAFHIVTGPNGEQLSGAVPGKYKVRIVHPHTYTYSKTGPPRPGPFPLKFSSAETSQLSAVVEKGRENTLDLKLETPPEKK